MVSKGCCRVAGMLPMCYRGVTEFHRSVTGDVIFTGKVNGVLKDF